MPNWCDTCYKVTGQKDKVQKLWNVLEQLCVNDKNVYLCELADKLHLDYKNKGYSMRGHIYWAEYSEEENSALLAFDVESAWSACDIFFDEVNKVFDGELSISYKETEPGCGIFYIHDEGNFFSETCCVSYAGEPFGDDAFEDPYPTIDDAIIFWCEKMNYDKENKTTEEMKSIIENYTYNDENTYFYINEYEFI